MNSINAIQPYNIYRVNPVNLFENRKQNTNMFAQHQYNLNHPNVTENNTNNGHLDFLA